MVVVLVREKNPNFRGLHNPSPDKEMVHAMPRYGAESVETQYERRGVTSYMSTKLRSLETRFCQGMTSDLYLRALIKSSRRSII